jgi:hypothetical protein
MNNGGSFKQAFGSMWQLKGEMKATMRRAGKPAIGGHTMALAWY